MADDVDRILRVRVVAEGLALTPGKNPWKTRALAGLQLGAFGAGAHVGFPEVPSVVAIVPASGPEAGGDLVTIEVDDSYGATGATIDGNALGSFEIVDATHVRGTVPAGTAGVVDVVVTNAYGPSTDGIGLYEYT